MRRGIGIPRGDAKGLSFGIAPLVGRGRAASAIAAALDSRRPDEALGVPNARMHARPELRDCGYAVRPGAASNTWSMLVVRPIYDSQEQNSSTRYVQRNEAQLQAGPPYRRRNGGVQQLENKGRTFLGGRVTGGLHAELLYGRVSTAIGSSDRRCVARFIASCSQLRARPRLGNFADCC
ncbi:hypothetical protein MRX96_041208 [Rhipicephalus microplus]